MFSMIRRRRLVCCLLLTPVLLSPFILCNIGMAAAWGYFFLTLFCGMLFLALVVSPAMTTTVAIGTPNAVPAPQLLPAPSNLPTIPRSAAETYSGMDDDTFELFSAALIMAKGHGHEFIEHSGKTADRGVDARLHNLYGQLVLIQSKHFTSGNNVPSSEIRGFAGAITHQQAVYGYFVTTSSFTPEALHAIHQDWRIRAIDGKQIDALLQHRYREIQLAYQEVLLATGRI